MAIFEASRERRRLETGGHQKVKMVELFFDLVFVFAITQLSHALLADVSVGNGLRMGLLLLAVWWAWIFTTWVTNWLEPDEPANRLMLFALMLAGLVMSAAIPRAFTDRGLAFALAFVAIQVGRSLYVCWAVRTNDASLYANFVRITCWLATAGLFWIAGGIAGGSMLFILWTVALAIEYAGPATGFWTPHLGRSTTQDWNIDPAHMAERCSLFIIIALGETLLISGATFATATWKPIIFAAFASVVVATIAMWWLYFNIGAEEAAERFVGSEDRGRIARLAYTYLHLPIVAGIVATAVAYELVLAHPYGATDAKTAWTMIGGPLTFVLGLLMFKRATAGRWPLSHLVGLAMLAATTFVVPLVSPTGLATVCAVILIVIAVWETISLGGRTNSRTPASKGH